MIDANQILKMLEGVDKTLATEMLSGYLKAARSNLEEYKRGDDENAIRAGEGMVRDFEELILKLDHEVL